MEQTITQSSGNWKLDQRRGYTAHYIPPKEELFDGVSSVVVPGHWEGPDDAFVWLGIPYEGNPYRSTAFDARIGKEIAVLPYVDHERLAAEIAGVPLEWVAWDETTHCNVYRRLTPTADAEETPEAPRRGRPPKNGGE